MPSEKISFEIVSHIGVVGSRRQSGWQKELNIVSWSGNTPKFDLRDWSEDHEHCGRGITLFVDEIKSLVDVFLRYQNQKTVEDAKAERAERRERYENSRRTSNQWGRSEEEDEAEDKSNEEISDGTAFAGGAEMAEMTAEAEALPDEDSEELKLNTAAVPDMEYERISETPF